MFDLEYYNKIVAYGNIYDELKRECQLKSGHTRRPTNENRTTKKEKMTIMAEYYMNSIVLFDNEHTEAYGVWFNTYYDKADILDRVAAKYIVTPITSAGLLRGLNKLHDNVLK
jgi:hypothetical protein